VYLLYAQISWAALTPLGVIFLCTGIAIASSPKLAYSQKTWLDKIQARVDATASMLGSMKAVKMTGLTPDLGKKIHDLREDEIRTARTFRGMLVKITACCKCTIDDAAELMLTISSLCKYIVQSCDCFGDVYLHGEVPRVP
jgi:ATP-binding cassette subfamily C (CFTR/MRP) protein 1